MFTATLNVYFDGLNEHSDKVKSMKQFLNEYGNPKHMHPNEPDCLDSDDSEVEDKQVGS